MATLGRAIAIAADAHQGQSGKAGKPYILHCIRVMLRMESGVTAIAAVLHDVVEDTDWTIEALRKEGFAEAVLKAVDHLTRRQEESYTEFIRRAAQNPIARQVKLADLEDNMDLRRIDNLKDRDLERLRKYHRARRELITRGRGDKPAENVVLRDRWTKKLDHVLLEASVSDAGALTISSLVGDASDDIEVIRKVAAQEVPKMLLRLIEQRFSSYSEIRKWLDDNDIQSNAATL